MSLDLQNKKPKDTYKALLTVDNVNSGIDAVLRAICDGEGTPSVLEISTDKIHITQGFLLEGKSVTLVGAADGYVWTYNATLERMELSPPGAASIDGVLIGSQTF